MISEERLRELWHEEAAIGDPMPLSFARAVEAEARREALEEAAKVAENTVCDVHLPTGVRIYGQKAAAAIRALIPAA